MRELILLSPYRLPAQSTQMLANDDVASFLNGYVCLWHPAAARGAERPPIVASPYDYEQPRPGQIFAIPESPPLLLPEDWDQRVLDAHALAFRSAPSRETTLANFKQALATFEDREKLSGNGLDADGNPVAEAPTQPMIANLLDLPASTLALFFSVGFGFLQIEGLFEAMEHENLLAAADLWQDVQAAVTAIADPDPAAVRRHLKSAADRLLAAREILYPVTIHLLDLVLLAEQKKGSGVFSAESTVAKSARLPEKTPDPFFWPNLRSGLALNLITCSETLEMLHAEHPEKLATLRERFQADEIDICGGSYREREDPLLPLESQLWNLLKGTNVARNLLGKDISVFARKRFGYHPQLPLFLNCVGLHRTVALTFDDTSLPSFRSTVTNWPSPDGKQVEAFTRKPFKADDPQTFFHLAYHLCQTIRQDHAATLAILHAGDPPSPWYDDWQELSQLAPVLGQWTTLTRYLGEVMPGEHVAAPSADEFHADFLYERIQANLDHPVSEFAGQVRRRRQMDTIWTLAAIYQGLTGTPVPLSARTSLTLRVGMPETPTRSVSEARLADLEDKSETGRADPRELDETQEIIAQALAERLQARASDNTPGYMVLNPCSFTRRLALELPTTSGLVPAGGLVKAAQEQGNKLLAVVEVPPLGFAWFARGEMPPHSQAGEGGMRLADSSHVRNEFFEAEIDPATGGLRGFWDQRTRASRLGQQLVFNPGSTTKANEVRVVSTGPALGEVVSEGTILGDQEQVLATFRQTFRAWLGRPILEMRIEIEPRQPPAGYGWHAYFGARFAWRDERALLLRGVNGTGYVTSHTRPETPDFLELRSTRQSSFIFPGGLPFHQRHSTRMLDVILIPEGEKTQTFDLALGLDREHPIQTALGMVTPPVLVPVSKGPPHVGACGWLFHLDAPNLLLTTLRPGPEGQDSITARMLECSLHGGPAELRCARNPKRAVLVDARGETLMETTVTGDAAQFEAAPGDLMHLRVEFI